MRRKNPVAYGRVTGFANKVLGVIRTIPCGRVATYADLARAVGRPRASRAAGNACNANPAAPVVPCHRVVRSDGTVGGYAKGTKKKIVLLTGEGITIVRGKIDLKKFGVRWR